MSTIVPILGNLFSNLVYKLQHVVEGREALSEGMDMYCSGAESLTNYHHLLHSLQQAVRNNVSRVIIWKIEG